MPWLIQLVGMGLLLIGIVVALYISVWVLAFFLFIGIAGVVWTHLKEFFIEKGIINPMPSPVEMDEEGDITIVEGDFTRVDSAAEIEDSKNS